MVTSDNARAPRITERMLHHSNVQRSELTAFKSLAMSKCKALYPKFGPYSYKKLCEAIAEGNVSRADTLLRSWGIRQ